MSGFIINENIIDEEFSDDNVKKTNQKNTNNTKKKKILDLIIVALVLVLLVCMFFIGRYYLQSMRNKGLNDDLIDEAVNYGDSSDSQDGFGLSGNNSTFLGDDDSGGKKEVKVPLSINFDKLLAQNKDVVGWIFSKNGVINYPILQGKDNSYYLNRLISGKKNINGSIFMDYSANSGFKDANTLIFGHSMDNGSMFRTLLNYKKQSYFDKYPEMIIYTPNCNYKLMIFSAYETNTSDMAYRKIRNDEDFDKFVKNAISKSKIKTNVNVNRGDNIVTLSTCAYSSKNARFLVLGKLVPVNIISDTSSQESFVSIESEINGLNSSMAQ